MPTHPADVLARLGRGATTGELVALCGRAALRRAVSDASVVRTARGHYALPGLADPRLAAERLCGVVSHGSAARIWGLPVLTREDAPHVTLPPHRKSRPGSATRHWLPLAPHEVVDGVTSPLRTVLDCARTLPFGPALAVADAALRLRLVRPVELERAAAGVRGPGARRARLVAAAADGRAASPMESVLRGHLLHGRIRTFQPQLVIADDGFRARVDLGDPRHRIVAEADSFEHHGSRAALVRDCRRYDELVVRGWLVLRFAWEHVMFEPDWVLATVRGALLTRSASTRRTVPTAAAWSVPA